MKTLAEFITFNRNEDGSWTAEIKDFQSFRNSLGDDILVGICRLLVGSERLDSILRLVHEVVTGKRSDQPSGNSDRMTLFLFAVGTLLEMSKAADLLSSSRLHEYLSPKGKLKWSRLRKVLKKILHDADIRHLRDKLSFHFDENTFRKGISELCVAGKPVRFASGIGQLYKDARIEIGTCVLLAGSNLTNKRFRVLLSITVPKQINVPSMIYELLREIIIE